MKVGPWIEAMRLRTLPVSLAGVVAALGYSRLFGCTDVTVFILCLLFALCAQIASNFANEYFDYKAGIDKPGRQGPRRGVTEGDITPQAMRNALTVTLGAASLIGISLIFWGGLIIILPGILIILGVLMYSTGPFPLSHRCLGEIAVICFFGLAPVCLTFYLMAGYVDTYVLAGSISIGLMGANVLLVNNIRDINDDLSVGKHTLPSTLGRRTGSFLYLFNGWLAVWLMGSVWLWIGNGWTLVPALYLFAHTCLWYRIDTLSRRAMKDATQAHKLNPCLGMTAVAMAVYAILFAVAA